MINKYGRIQIYSANIKRANYNILKLPIYIYFDIKGINPFRWDRLASAFIQDFRKSNASFKQKIWAYKRGFLSERIDRYQLNNDNYRFFMSDLEFYKTKTYKNLRFTYWFDDKLTTWFILQPFIQHLPLHYYSIENKKIRQLYTENITINNTVAGIVSLLKEKKELAFKKTTGGGGIGFFKLSYTDDCFLVNNESMSQVKFEKFILSFNGYHITEYIHTHKQLQKIYDKTPNAIRIISIYDDVEGAKVTSAFIRFGTSQTSFVDNASAGAIYAGVKIDDGTFFNPSRNINGHIIEAPVHPDTNIEVSGVVPNWDLIKEGVSKISNYLNNTPYLSYDVVATDDGFKILEINSHGILTNMQPFYPFFNNPYQKKLFSTKK
jgi:hypothetical protein